MLVFYNHIHSFSLYGHGKGRVDVATHSCIFWALRGAMLMCHIPSFLLCPQQEGGIHEAISNFFGMGFLGLGL